MKNYYELLKDPRWQKKRLEVMERAGFECEECENNEVTLNVHHTYYEKGKMPWEYPTESLQCLCEECHKRTKQVQQKKNKTSKSKQCSHKQPRERFFIVYEDGEVFEPNLGLHASVIRVKKLAKQLLNYSASCRQREINKLNKEHLHEARHYREMYERNTTMQVLKKRCAQ